jgi:hypothetical protein
MECGGECLDLATDPNNCGKCGHACLTMQLCTGGVCSCNPTYACFQGVGNDMVKSVLCPAHAKLLAAVETCQCSGACKQACDSLCTNMGTNQSCIDCMNTGGCENETVACDLDMAN